MEVHGLYDASYFIKVERNVMEGNNEKKGIPVWIWVGAIVLLIYLFATYSPNPTMLNSKNIVLSSNDISADLDLMGMIPNADYTGEITRSYGRPTIVDNPNDISNAYKRVFSGECKFLGRPYVSIFSLNNAVAIYKSEQKARAIFAEATPIPVDLKMFGAVLNVPVIGNEAKGWQENVGYTFNHYLY